VRLSSIAMSMFLWDPGASVPRALAVMEQAIPRAPPSTMPALDCERCCVRRDEYTHCDMDPFALEIGVQQAWQVTTIGRARGASMVPNPSIVKATQLAVYFRPIRHV
jgi:hypothetical protein